MSKTELEPAATLPVLRYVLEQSDYDAMANAAQGPLDRFMWRWAFWPAALANAAASLWFLWPVALGEHRFELIYSGNLMIAVALLAYRFWLRPWKRRWTLRQSRLAGRPYEIVFGDDRIDMTAGGLSSQIDLAEITSFTETDNYFFFWLSRLQAVIAPKRAIKTSEEEAALRRYAASAKWKKQ